MKRREEGRRTGERRQKSTWRSRRKRRIRRVGDSSNLMQVTTIYSFSYS